MRGQVTMFIILGIFIIAIFIGLFAFKDYFLKSEFEREAEKISVSKDIEPVFDYLKNCIKDVGEDGVKIIASQGGYLDIERPDFSVNPLMPFSNSLDIFNNDALKVAYWFYETDNGIQRNNIPSLENIEEDISTYIEENINTCLYNYSVFKGYEVSDFNDLDVRVDIADDKIFVTVNTDMKVDYKDLEGRIDVFKVVLDMPLGSLYKVANEIMEEENKEYFFEEKTIDMMVLYDEIPLNFVEFSCERKVWQKSKVIDDFKRIVNLNLRKINLNKDDYYSIGINSNINTGFTYNEEWPFYVDIYPSDGEVLKGDSFIQNKGITRFLSRLFCLNDYKFVYDVKYPVLVKLSKDNLDFLFAFQVLIKSNEPRQRKADYQFEKTQDLCENKNSFITVNTKGVDNFGNIVDLDNVEVNYKCFSYVCDVGESVNGVISNYVPSCYNGLVIGEKEGYFEGTIFASTNQEVESNIILEPIYDKEVEIKLIDKNSGIVKDVDEENVVIDFESDKGYTTSLDYNTNKNVGLIEDNYKMNSYVTVEGNIHIEGEKIKQCVDVPKGGFLGLLFKEEKCFETEIEDTDLDNVIIGGNNFEFYFDRENLVTDNKIVIYVTVDKIPTTNEEIMNIYNSLERGSLSENFKYLEYE